MADGEVSAKGRSWVCVASFMTAVFLLRALAADSALKPKLKPEGSLQYSGCDKQPYSRVGTNHCVQSQ
jgi:hypothetical protein